MKAIVLISTAALAMATLASPAMAQSFAETSSTSNLSGSLNLEQTQNIDCETSIDVSINSVGAATVTGRSFSAGNPIFCGIFVQPLGAWTVTPGGPVGSSTNLRYVTANVGAQSIAGTCFGSVTGIYDNNTGELEFTNAVIPSSDPQDCIINGSLFASPKLTIVP